jgi:hypothetical protein
MRLTWTRYRTSDVVEILYERRIRNTVPTKWMRYRAIDVDETSARMMLTSNRVEATSDDSRSHNSTNILALK